MCSEGSIEYWNGYAAALDELIEVVTERWDPWRAAEVREIAKEMRDNAIGGRDEEEEE